MLCEPALPPAPTVASADRSWGGDVIDDTAIDDSLRHPVQHATGSLLSEGASECGSYGPSSPSTPLLPMPVSSTAQTR